MAQKERANISARIYKISDRKCKIKIYNCGEGVVYNVDYKISEEYQIICMKEIGPFEILNPGCKFEENVVIHMQSSKKYKITMSWKDSEGNEFHNETLESW